MSFRRWHTAKKNAQNYYGKNRQELSFFTWSVADLLRGNHKHSDCGKVVWSYMVLAIWNVSVV